MEAIVWLIFIAIWFISGVVKSIKQVADQRPGQPGQEPAPSQEPAQRQRPEPARQAPAEDPMIKLLRQLSGEPEVRPENPPRESPRQAPQQPLHQQPLHQQRSQQQSQQRSQHQTARAEAAPPAPRVVVQSQRARPVQARDTSAARAAKTPPIPKFDLTARPKIAAPLVSHGRPSGGAMARSLRSDLRNPSSVRKAILLQEILGKPLGLQGLPGRGPRG